MAIKSVALISKNLFINDMDIRNFDIFFITYDEPNTESKLKTLKEYIPNLKHINGIAGENNAWLKAAQLSSKPFFIKIDADCEIKPGFSFSIDKFQSKNQSTHVWRSLNPVNGLVYGFGSMQMHSVENILSIKKWNDLDPTISASERGIIIQEECATITNFNADEFTTWKSALRECYRIASRKCIYLGGSYLEKTNIERLKVWCSIGRDAKYGEFCLLGARMGTYLGFSDFKNGSNEQITVQNYFNTKWQELNVLDNVQTLSSRFKQRLEREFNFCLVEIDSVQSHFLKSMWNNLNRDVYLRTCRYPKNLNY